MRMNLDLDKGSFRKELDRFFPDLDDRVLDASKGMWLDIQDRLSRFKDSVSNLVCPVPTLADLLAQGGRLAVWHDMSLPQILQRLIWPATRASWRSSHAGSEEMTWF